MRKVSLAAYLSLAWPLAATAQDLPGDPVAGSELAEEVCAVCHAVSERQVDPEVGAPSFAEVTAHPSVTALSLRAFLQTPHATMPNLRLTPEETDNIIAYLLTLKGG
jgi:mono/diheme cytochrome c family protein